jgi:hypothetical protein
MSDFTMYAADNTAEPQLQVKGHAYIHGNLTVKGTVIMGQTIEQVEKKFPDDVRAVMQEARIKAKWLVPDQSLTFQDQMVIGLAALLAEERAKNCER